MDYVITKEDFIGFWRDADGEKYFFGEPTSDMIIEVIEKDSGLTFKTLWDDLMPDMAITLNELFSLSEKQITNLLCMLMWHILLVIANKYEEKYVDVPEIKWVFDTPNHPFEQYLVTMMPDAYEKYKTTR